MSQSKKTRLLAGITLPARSEGGSGPSSSEDRYRQMFERNPAVQLLIDPASGAIVDANPAAVKFYGYDLGTLKQANISAVTLLAQKDIAKTIAQIVHGQQQQFHFQHRLASGAIRDVAMSLCLVSLIGRRLLHAIIHDITEQKRAEVALRRQVEFEKLIAEISCSFLKLSPEEFDNGIHHALQVIGEFDGVDRSYFYLLSSDCTTVKYGYEWCAPGIKGELKTTLAMPIANFSWSTEQMLKHEVLHVPRVADLPPEAAIEKAEFEAQGVQSLLVVPLLADPFFGFLGFDVVRTEKTWSEESITLLKIVREMLAQLLQRRRAEQLRREETKVTAALARVGRELIVSLRTPTLLDRLCQVTAQVLDCDYSHTYLWNAREESYSITATWGETPEQIEMFRLFRFSAAQVQSLINYFQQEDAMELDIAQLSSFLPLPAEFFAQRGVTRAIYMALRQGEEVVGAQTASYRNRRESCTPQQLRIARGIGQLASLALGNARLLEEKERVNRLKTDFLATMSHELRTPLNIIIGYTDMLLEKDCGELATDQEKLLVRVEANARELLELINAMLDVSRFDAGRSLLDRQTVDVVALMEEIQRETANKILKSEVALAWQIPQTPFVLFTDRTKLKVIVKNLVGNALKFTERGIVSIVTNTAADGLEICVIDTGIGIPAEVLPVIFDMFRQGDSSTMRQYDGVGLGLYIVRRLLDLLGGTISVESEVGRGSTFRVWLPNEVIGPSGR
jgi:PAS domain S-box-containing protein